MVNNICNPIFYFILFLIFKSEQIQIRKIRLNFMNHSIQRLREQIEQSISFFFSN
jgi:hypothetical protein